MYFSFDIRTIVFRIVENLQTIICCKNVEGLFRWWSIEEISCEPIGNVDNTYDEQTRRAAMSNITFNKHAYLSTCTTKQGIIQHMTSP